MDDQHGILMDAVNELRLAQMHGSGREQIGELLDRLIEFTRMHFWSEEQLMEQTGFPALAEHRSEHRSFLAQVLQWAHRLQYGEAVQICPLLCFLRDWLTEHIEEVDRQYGPWLNERGIS
jgi:hemerythrin-like metal-binding protein